MPGRRRSTGERNVEQQADRAPGHVRDACLSCKLLCYNLLEGAFPVRIRTLWNSTQLLHLELFGMVSHKKQTV